MSSINRDNFSPFFKDKKLVLALRLLFGFPLKPTNEAFDQFAFKPVLEYSRLALALCVQVVCFGYITYIPMKQLNIWNPWKAVHQYTNSVGISDMDYAVIILLPILQMAIFISYFLSFKKAKVGLNKILGLLIKVKEETYGTGRGMKLHHSTPYWRFLLIFAIFVLAVALNTFCWPNLMLSDSSTKTETVIFYFVSAITSANNVYPFMSISADFLVVQLVDETSNAFDNFRLKIKYVNKFYKEREGKKESSGLCNAKKRIFSITR